MGREPAAREAADFYGWDTIRCIQNGAIRPAEEIAERLKLPLIFVPGCHNFPSDLPREFAVTVSGVITLMSADERRSVDKMREI